MNDMIQGAVEATVLATPDLQRLRGKNIFITGGTGFIGTWLLESIAYLNDQGREPCRAYVLTRDLGAFARKAPHLARRAEFTFLVGDIRSLTALAERCDYIIHAAASASPLAKAESPVEVGETIVEGTRRVLELAQQWNVDGMLFLSSGAVYGVQPSELERVPEDFRGGPDLSAPISTYAEGKRFAEVLCVAYHQVHAVPAVIARPFTFVGPYQALDSGFAVTDFIRDGLSGAPLHVNGDGTALRSYSGPADMLRMLWGLLFRGRSGQAYNVGSDEPISILEVARRVASIVGRPHDIVVAHQLIPGRLPARYVPDLAKIRTLLGYNPRVSLEDSLGCTIAWLNAQRGLMGADRRLAQEAER